MNDGSQRALRQTENRRYAEKRYDDGNGKVLRFRIACRKKRCTAALAEGEKIAK